MMDSIWTGRTNRALQTKLPHSERMWEWNHFGRALDNFAVTSLLLLALLMVFTDLRFLYGLWNGSQGKWLKPGSYSFCQISHCHNPNPERFFSLQEMNRNAQHPNHISLMILDDTCKPAKEHNVRTLVVKAEKQCVLSPKTGWIRFSRN